MSLIVEIVSTGTANLASVMAGLRRADAEPRICRDPDVAERADRLVLPGVGAFAPAMSQLSERGFSEVLRRRIEAGRPTLAVCLGLQVLCRASEENPGVAGLGLIEGDITRFPETVRVPQLGWNQVEPEEGCRLLKSGYAYFANSFRLADKPQGWNVAFTDHAGPFVAALERGPVLACQFHPELSGPWGLELLKRWLADSQKGGGAC